VRANIFSGFIPWLIKGENLFGNHPGFTGTGAGEDEPGTGAGHGVELGRGEGQGLFSGWRGMGDLSGITTGKYLSSG